VAIDDRAQVRSEQHEGALGPYLRAIRAHRVVVAAVTLIALLSAIAWHTQRDSRYEATVKLLVAPLSPDNATFDGVALVRDSNDPTRTAQTAAALIESAQAAEATAREIGRGDTRRDVQAAIKVRPQGESNILAVTAEATDPALAARLANTYAAQSLAIRATAVREQLRPIIARLEAGGLPDDQRRARTLEGVTGDPTLSIAERALAADEPIGARGWLIALLALVAGFVVGAAAALLMEQLGQRLREEEEFVRVYPLPILARVPKVRSRMFGGGDLTDVPPGVREAYRTLQVQVEQLEPDSRIFMLTSGSSGDGKTSSAINLALALVAGGHRVILMDLDPRKPDLTRILGLSESPGVMDALGAGTSLDELLVPAPRMPPLSVLPGGAGAVLSLDVLSRRLRSLMAAARELADYVIVDTAPLGQVSDALRIVPFVDEVILVARPGDTQRPQFQLLRELLERAHVVPLGIVMVGTADRASSSYYGYGQPSERAPRRFSLARDAED
jgi:capsular exopolysaccharide synthesis family protein